MKKKISQISLILLIMIIGILFAIKVYAADAELTVPSGIREGDSFTVTVTIPSEAVGYQGIIKVYYKSKGITDSSGFLMKLTGMDGGNFSHPGNMAATFTAKATGEVVISVEECVISDKDFNPFKNPSAKNITIAEKQTTPPASSTPSTPNTPSTPSNPTTPSTPLTPSTPSTDKPSTSTTTPKFTDVNETVYTTTRCNLRESYSTSSNRVATVNAETKLTRKGVGDNGWSKC